MRTGIVHIKAGIIETSLNDKDPLALDVKFELPWSDF